MLKEEKQEILLRLQFILGKIVFEGFNFRDFANESYLQFEEVQDYTA